MGSSKNNRQHPCLTVRVSAIYQEKNANPGGRDDEVSPQPFFLETLTEFTSYLAAIIATLQKSVKVGKESEVGSQRSEVRIQTRAGTSDF
jgi:hypothetical protein